MPNPPKILTKEERVAEQLSERNARRDARESRQHARLEDRLKASGKLKAHEKLVFDADGRSPYGSIARRRDK